MASQSRSFEQIYAGVDGETTRSLAEFRRDHPPKKLRVDGHTWDYVAFGRGGTPVLFLHGMAGAYDIWWQVLKALEERYRVLSLTYPPVEGLEALARGILAILTKEGISRTNVVGSSLGGYLAQFLAARQPERIRRAVLANTFPPNDLVAQRNRAAGRVLPLLPSWLLMRNFRQSVERAIYPASGNSEIVRAFLLEQSSGAMSKAQFLARYHCVIASFDPPELESLQIPTMIIEADNDPLVDETLREMLKATYPSAMVRTLHGLGHFPYLNQPTTYSALLRHFLQDETH
jgi:maspardin